MPLARIFRASFVGLIKRVGRTRLTLAVLLVILGVRPLLPRQGPPDEADLDRWIHLSGTIQVPAFYVPLEKGSLNQSDEATVMLRFWRRQAEPLLIKRLEARDSSWSLAWRKLHSRLPPFLAARLPLPPPAATIRQETVLAIGALRGLSSPLEAALVARVQDPDPMVRLFTAVVLGHKGSPAPATLKAFDKLHKDPAVAGWFTGFTAGRPLYPPKSASVPEWIADLDRPWYGPRYEAVGQLAKCAAPAEIVVSALLHALDDRVEVVSNAAARGLGRFGPVASNALPILRHKLESPTRITREIAQEAISLIDVEHHLVEPVP